MHVPRERVIEELPHPLPRPLRLFPVERLNQFPAEPQHLTALDQRVHDGLTHVGVGEAHDRGHRGDPANHLFPRDHDPGAGSGQPDLGEALRQDDVVVPERGGIREDDVRKGSPIGVIDNQGNIVLLGQIRQMPDFVVGQDVAGRVGGTRDTEGRHLLGNDQVIEINPVLELVVAGNLDPRFRGSKEIPADGLVGIADVLRHQGQEDLLAPPVGEAARQRVEKEKESGLPASRDPHVLRSEFPSELAAEQPGHRGPELTVAGRALIVAKHVFQFVGRRGDFLQAAAPDGIHLGNVGRLAAPQHSHAFTTGRERRPEVLHQFPDPASGAQPTTEF